MKRPMISFAVVINGPVATAGSILNLFNKRGTKVPNTEAKMITAKSEELTVMVSAYVSAVNIL